MRERRETHRKEREQERKREREKEPVQSIEPLAYDQLEEIF